MLIPAALVFLMTGPIALTDLVETPALYGLLSGFGLISAAALLLYLCAMRRLNVSLFGLPGYVEPVLLVVVAFLLSETLSKRELGTYVSIRLAVGVLVVVGVV